MIEPPQLQLVNWSQPMPARVRAAYTTRRQGVSATPYAAQDGSGGLNLATHVGDSLLAVRENRRLLQRAMQEQLQVQAQPIWLNQVHGARVLRAEQLTAGLLSHYEDADASIACGPGLVCTVMMADCLPVLFCDSDARVVGAAHAGWRGLAGGVLQNTVLAMRAQGAGEIYAWLGPAIGPSHFQVGAEVREAFQQALGAAALPAFVEQQDGKFLADIFALARLALQTVHVAQIAGGQWCTVSNPEQFYSYRRERTCGRMAAFICLQD